MENLSISEAQIYCKYCKVPVNVFDSSDLSQGNHADCQKLVETYAISDFYKENKINFNDIRSLIFSCQPNLRAVGLHGLAKTKDISNWLPAFFDDKNVVEYRGGCFIESKTIGEVVKQLYDGIV